MYVNEVLANSALGSVAGPAGPTTSSRPGHLKLHQSTNDTFPTALRIAAIRGLRDLERAVLALQEAFQDRERAFAHIVKVGRTEYQDAVLTTLGREMGAYAEALSRDRWRLAKCEERLRVVNLGGTASAPASRRRGRTSSVWWRNSGSSRASAWRARRTWSTRRRTPTPSWRSQAS